MQLARDVIGFGFYIPVYELLYRNLYHKNDTLANIVAGGTAGSLSWISICPLDVIKSRMQSQNFQNPTYKSWMHCTMVTYRKEGLGAFFKGGLVLAVRGFPVNAVIFLFYANSRSFLEKVHLH